MPYTTAQDLRQVTLRGLYQPSNFVLPTDSLNQIIAVTPAVSPAAKGAILKAANRKLSGAFVPAAWNVPPYRTLGDVTSTVSEMTNWLKDNVATVAAVGLVAVLLLGMGGRSRR